MPKRVSRPPLLTTLQREAGKTLAVLHKEISQREQELATHKAEATRWQSVLRAQAGGNGPAPPTPRRRSAKRRRLDWSTILRGLPARFTTKDLAQKSGKPIAQVYAYVSRWTKDKKVRRGKDGYEKV